MEKTYGTAYIEIKYRLLCYMSYTTLIIYLLFPFPSYYELWFNILGKFFLEYLGRKKG